MKVEKAVEHVNDSDTNCNRWTQDNPKRLGKGSRRVRNQRTSEWLGFIAYQPL